MRVSDNFARIDDSAKVTLAGSLLSAGSTLDINRDLLNIRTGGQLVTSSADPVVLLVVGPIRSRMTCSM